MKYWVYTIAAVVVFTAGLFTGRYLYRVEPVPGEPPVHHVDRDPSRCLHSPIGIRLQRSPAHLEVTATDGCKRTIRQFPRESRPNLVTVGIGYGISGVTYSGSYQYEVLPGILAGGQCSVARDYAAIHAIISYRW